MKLLFYVSKICFLINDNPNLIPILSALLFSTFFSCAGKHIGRLGHQDPGEFPEEVKALFEKGVEYYEENMALMVEIQVRS